MEGICWFGSTDSLVVERGEANLKWLVLLLKYYIIRNITVNSAHDSANLVIEGGIRVIADAPSKFAACVMAYAQVWPRKKGYQ